MSKKLVFSMVIVMLLTAGTLQARKGSKQRPEQEKWKQARKACDQQQGQKAFQNRRGNKQGQRAQQKQMFNKWFKELKKAYRQDDREKMGHLIKGMNEHVERRQGANKGRQGKKQGAQKQGWKKGCDTQKRYYSPKRGCDRCCESGNRYWQQGRGQRDQRQNFRGRGRCDQRQNYRNRGRCDQWQNFQGRGRRGQRQKFQGRSQRRQQYREDLIPDNEWDW